MSGKWHGGKGSSIRKTNHNKYSKGYDLAFGKKDKSNNESKVEKKDKKK